MEEVKPSNWEKWIWVSRYVNTDWTSLNIRIPIEKTKSTRSYSMALKYTAVDRRIQKRKFGQLWLWKQRNLSEFMSVFVLIGNNTVRLFSWPLSSVRDITLHFRRTNDEKHSLSRQFRIFLFARALIATVILRIVPAVLPHSFAAFWKIQYNRSCDAEFDWSNACLEHFVKEHVHHTLVLFMA